MFRNLDYAATRTLTYKGESYLFFGGTAYLGLNTHADFLAYYQEGLAKYGLNVGTSRNSNVQLGIYDEAEEVAAKRFGFESAVMFSSGFLAAQAAVSSIGAEAEWIYSPDTHPALWRRDKEPLIPTGSFEEWVADTVTQINASARSSFVVVSNTVDNLAVSVHDFSGFSGITADKEVCFILDHSHGIGILHNHRSLPQGDRVRVLVVASLAKGIGIDAGVILGDKGTIAHLRRTPVFAGASPPAPASMHAFIRGAAIYEAELARLSAHIDFFHRHVRIPCRMAAGLPVIGLQQPTAFETVFRHRIVISSFAYPLPTSPLLNRVVLSSAHTEEDVAYLIDVLHRCEAGPIDSKDTS